MRDLSLHLLDIIQNSIVAGGNLIKILIREDNKENWLTLLVEDNGKGMAEETIKVIADPFYTTRKERKVGLGIPLLKVAAERCEGRLEIKSSVSKGTKIKAEFQLNHIDRPPFGDLNDTIASLILCNPQVDFVYKHETVDGELLLDTREVRHAIGDMPIEHPDIVIWIQSYIEEGLNEINGGVQ